MDEEKIDNPFEEKPLDSGEIRLGRPITYRKTRFELVKNVLISIILLLSLIFIINYIFDHISFWLVSIAVLSYSVTGYWVHPEPDHDSMHVWTHVFDNPFTYKDNENYTLLLLAGFLRPGMYIALSFVELLMYWNQEKT